MTSNFYLSVLAPSPHFTDPSRQSDVMLLEPVTRAAVAAIIAESSVPLMVFETFRSQARQKVLYDRGVTELEKVGVHGFGLACDLVKIVNGQPSWRDDFGFLGVLAKKHGLIWGGDWNRPSEHHALIDAVHVQRCALADQPKLFARTWFPSDDYNPYGASP